MPSKVKYSSIIAVSHECELSPAERFGFESAGWVQGQRDFSSYMLQMFSVSRCLQFFQCLCNRFSGQGNVHLHCMFFF